MHGSCKWTTPGHTAANGYYLCSRVGYTAARNGRLRVLKWAHSHDLNLRRSNLSRCCPGRSTLHTTVGAGTRLSMGFSTCSEAATGGHFELLKRARCNGCPWDVSTLLGAAAGGLLDILQWVQEEGCPRYFAPCTCTRAVEQDEEDTNSSPRPIYWG